ncbi:MAG: IS30 family transposase [Thomasclavelia sp.]|nr:IS30 family transposase [Thomasclavelia sp.]
MNYYHININERIVISQLYHSNISIRMIAKQLNRSPSTISRELRRNSYKKGIHHSVTSYSPANAQEKYDKRKMNCGRKEFNDKETINIIKTKLEDHWSPEQIYYRLSMIQYMPCTSTIYHMIHKGVFKGMNMARLRRKGHFIRPCETRGRFNDGGRTIKKRSKMVYKRQELGHWEGDTVESGRIDHKRKSKYCFVTLAERRSRFYIAILVPDRTSKNVTPAIINALKQFPNDLVKTITFDRGKEFSGYEEIEEELNCNTYFCDPYCAWQKGTNENTNGLLREFYPKGMDLSSVNTKELEHNLELLNNRPRKCLKYKTPKEVINK